MRLPKFRLFDYDTPGPGVEKDAPKKKGLALFWDILSRRFWKMVTLNLVYMLFSIPSYVIMWFATYTILTFFCSELMLNDAKFAESMPLLCMYLTAVIYALFGGGAPTSGMTYVIRNYRRDTHSWMWADFISKFKENFVKSTCIFIIDTIMLFLMGANFWFYGKLAATNIVAYLLQGLMVVLFLIFLLMHAYIYPIHISFDKKLSEIYKSAFILALGKLPTTAASMALCTLICGTITFLAFYITVYAMLLIPIMMFTFSCYVNLYITFPIIEKYMVKKSAYEE